MEKESDEKIVYGMDIEDAKCESKYLYILVQEKLANFFYNSSMDDRFLKFDILTNELDVLRTKIFEVKEQSKYYLTFSK